MMPGRASAARELTTDQPRRILGNPLLWLMVAASATNYFDRSILGIAAPSLIRESGISETAMGAIFSAFLISYTALMAPAGWLADRVGGQRVMAFAALGWGVSTIATPIATWIGLTGSLAYVWMLAIRFYLAQPVLRCILPAPTSPRPTSLLRVPLGLRVLCFRRPLWAARRPRWSSLL